MEKLVEGFGDDLEKLRTVSDRAGWVFCKKTGWLNRQSDPTLGPSKLQLLIDSLASGELYRLGLWYGD
jgi:hypothetical protein